MEKIKIDVVAKLSPSLMRLMAIQAKQGKEKEKAEKGA